MKQRIITGIIGVVVLGLIIMSKPVVLSVIVALVSLMALYEISSATGLLQIGQNPINNFLVTKRFVSDK